MEPTQKEFLTIFSEFTCEDSGKVEFLFDIAKSRVSETNFCDERSYRMAVYLILAHTLTILRPGCAENGKVSSEKVGDISVSYDTTSGGDNEFSSTQYGLQYLRLIKENTLTVRVL